MAEIITLYSGKSTSGDSSSDRWERPSDNHERMETAGETADSGKDWTGVCGPSTSTHIFARSKPNNSYEYA